MGFQPLLYASMPGNASHNIDTYAPYVRYEHSIPYLYVDGYKWDISCNPAAPPQYALTSSIR